MRSTKEKRVYIEAVASLVGYKLCYYNPGDFGRYRLTQSGDYFDSYKYSALSLADMYTYAVGMLAGYTSVSAEAEAVAYAFVNAYISCRSRGYSDAISQLAAEAQRSIAKAEAEASRSRSAQQIEEALQQCIAKHTSEA